MLNCNDIPCEIVALGENVKSKILYDVESKAISSAEFFRLKFFKDRMDSNHICKIIYKNVTQPN